MERTLHPFAPEEVMAYLDGELSPQRAAEAAAHLQHCAQCRALAAELRSVAQQVAGWQVEAAPQSLTEAAVRTAASPAPQAAASAPAQPAEAKHARRWFAGGLLWWGGALAAAALLLFTLRIPVLYRSSERAILATGAAVSPSLPPGPPPAGPGLAPPITAGKADYSDYALKAPGAKDRNRTAASSATQPSIPHSGAATSVDGRLQPEIAPKDESPRSNQNYRGWLAENKSLAVQSSAADRAAAPQAEGSVAGAVAAPSNQPMIIRNATLALLTKEFDSARAATENLVKAHQGYFGQLTVETPANAGRSLSASLRVPAAQLDAVLIELRKLGHVEQENQSADDVTRQYVDLSARLANARETEKRLVEILRERTGKVSEVLEVEQQISSVREQIERMDAERKNLENQVQYASVDLRITEEYKQSLDQPAPSLGTRLHNAAVDGFLGAADLLLGLVVFCLNAGPTLLLLAALLAWPLWRAVRWLRRRIRLAEAPASQSA